MRTQSEELLATSHIEKSVTELVREVVKQSQNIKGIKNPDPERQEGFKKSTDEIGKNRGRPLYFQYVGSGLGRGPYVELEDGSVKLDFINGIGIHILGHSHPRVIEASLRGAMSDIVMQGNLQPNKEYIEISRKLIEVASRKSKLRHVWLATCGTLANENALKMCRQKVTPARMIIAMQGAFAGRSTMMAEVTDNPNFKVGLPEYNEVLRIPFYDKNNPRSIETSLEALKAHVGKHEKNICAFTFEPVQGEGGFHTAPREYFLPLLEFCRSKQIPIWWDEVQTFTRTGEFFAFQTMDLGDYVDVCTIAKTAQNGATLYTEEFNPKPGLIAGTFSGSSASLSAGIEILNILDRDGYMGKNGRVAQIHKQFVDELNRLASTTCKGLLSDAGGLGLMVAVTPFDGSKEKTEKVIQTLYKNGLISFSCGRGPYRLRFLVPAIVETKDIKLAAEIIEKTMLELR